MKQKNFFKKVFAIRGLILNPNTKNPEKIVQNLALPESNGIVLWHDLINNSISKHSSNNFTVYPTNELILTLSTFQPPVIAVVYIQRKGTNNILTELKQSELDVIKVEEQLATTQSID